MMASSQRDPEKPGNGGGNGKHADRRTGVDRRIADDRGFAGQERRHGARRRPERQPDKPIKR